MGWKNMTLELSTPRLGRYGGATLLHGNQIEVYKVYRSASDLFP